MARVNPTQSQVLLMGSSGFTCKEMAAVLGAKPDSLYMLISRAKAQFEKERGVRPIGPLDGQAGAGKLLLG